MNKELTLTTILLFYASDLANGTLNILQSDRKVPDFEEDQRFSHEWTVKIIFDEYQHRYDFL